MHARIMLGTLRVRFLVGVWGGPVRGLGTLSRIHTHTHTQQNWIRSKFEKVKKFEFDEQVCLPTYLPVCLSVCPFVCLSWR